VTHEVVMRHEVVVAPNMRFIWLTGPNNNVLNVVSVQPNQSIASRLEIQCCEEV
jgi:head-tail adaptor